MAIESNHSGIYHVRKSTAPRNDSRFELHIDRHETLEIPFSMCLRCYYFATKLPFRFSILFKYIKSIEQPYFAR